MSVAGEIFIRCLDEWDWIQAWNKPFRHSPVVGAVAVVAVVALKCGGLEFPVMDIDHSLQSIIPTRACHRTDSIV